MASSVYALSQINYSTSTVRKLFWFLFLIVGTVGCAYKSYQFFKTYFLYPIIFTLTVEHVENLEFPAVSVCNFNRLEFSKQARTILLLSERRNFFHCNEANDPGRNETKQNMRLFLMKYYEMDAETRFLMGQNLSIFIEKCLFRGRLCDRNHSKYFQNSRYGNCITFNKGNKEMKILTVSDSGPNTGLILELNLQYDYYEKNTEAIGARVVIHDPSVYPSPEHEGFNLSPGFEILVSLQQSVTYRLPAPFRDRCIDYETHQGSSVKNQKDCVKTCIQTENFAKCGCTDQTLNVMSNLKHCDLTNDTEMCCLDKVLKNLSNYGPFCDCPLPCKSVSYNEMSSAAVWPSMSSPMDPYTPKQYKIRLNVFFSSLEGMIYEQKPKFKGYQLLSYLGCELGMWLGLSLISVFEIVVLCHSQ
ncbi:hypothetical protein TNCT_200441 [Trichonephila clavata]|uniref:Uncharacterized protein n=1 Tax=Trichonephila clavata TaxID=2740835 RepID=A0A8X6HHJ3_TRICU|nr:hypothetical protein TNCT_200441 [Trichonephila clavata]